MEFKPRADQISHTLSTTRHRCNLGCVGLGAKSRRWAPLTCDTRKGLSEYNEDLIFLLECNERLSWLAWFYFAYAEQFSNIIIKFVNNHFFTFTA